MDNDSIRSVGGTTLVDMWIAGKLRSICVTRAAIEDSLGAEKAAALSDDERCEFVRQHMAQVVKAARDWLGNGNADAGNVVIDSGHLPRLTGPRPTDRRKGERRAADRRRVDVGRPEGNRRTGTRRKRERRHSSAPKPADG
ncbi:MAG: hypothetical protein ACJ8FG_02520 [Sphingomicrobium sp.]